MISRKKAVVVGINYVDSATARLNGCINDAMIVHGLLVSQGYSSPNTIRMLIDRRGHAYQPTRSGIVSAIEWLVADAKSGDQLFFHYSGHGSQVKDRNGDEKEDRLDETICPSDYVRSGFIVDDDLRKILVAPLAAGVRLTVVLDCCHSQTGCDLTSKDASVVCLSGCRDSQTAADAVEDGKAQGALTWAFQKAWRPQIRASDLLTQVNALLRKHKYTQVATITGSATLFLI